jgi:hypothetical protein
MITETGGPAFPVFHQNEITGYVPPESAGMTLRDYFASKAMQGLLSETKTSDGAMIARDSYKMADAMLKARQA